MPGADTGKLERSLSALTIGQVQSERKYAKNLRADALDEIDEQFRIAIKGTAEEEPKWDKVRLKFGVRFVDATGQRDSPFDRPHFTFGAELVTKDPIGVLACVMKWKTNDKNETVGCTIAVGAISTLESTRFKGEVHLTFSGYGSPTDADMDVGDSA